MADVFDKQKRSEVMSKIKSKWTTPERILHNYLKGHKIKHKMHPNIQGSPDILISDMRLVVYVNGCFWHKCPKCYRQPKTKKKYWVPKIENNVKRDKKNIKVIKKAGFKVKIVWEHEIPKKIDSIIEKIKKAKNGT